MIRHGAARVGLIRRRALGCSKTVVGRFIAENNIVSADTDRFVILQVGSLDNRETSERVGRGAGVVRLPVRNFSPDWAPLQTLSQANRGLPAPHQRNC